MMCPQMKHNSLGVRGTGRCCTGGILEIVSLVEIEREWIERNKENKQINVAS